MTALIEYTLPRHASLSRGKLDRESQGPADLLVSIPSNGITVPRPISSRRRHDRVPIHFNHRTFASGLIYRALRYRGENSRGNVSSVYPTSIPSLGRDFTRSDRVSLHGEQNESSKPTLRLLVLHDVFGYRGAGVRRILLAGRRRPGQQQRSAPLLGYV